MKNLPPVTVRESQKAKKVILKLSLHQGLEVVIPQGFHRSKIPQIIQQKKPWIEQTWRQLQERGLGLDQSPELPGAFSCPAIGQDYTVEYVPAGGPGVHLFFLSPSQLKIFGDLEQKEACQNLLQRWLSQQGQVHLVPWLARLSAETGLTYQKVQIRGQKSRWGSCSGRGTISLNYNLLFLRPGAVRYLLLHELCHTRHLNHSGHFYGLLEALEPNWRAWRQELRQAWPRLPWWAQ